MNKIIKNNFWKLLYSKYFAKIFEKKPLPRITGDSFLPKWGGAMVHSDPQMTDFINLPVPKNNVKLLWHKKKYKGRKGGTIGNGIAGNGQIAACPFNGLRDNLVIYDYNGNYLWHSDKRLNALAAGNTPMVGINNHVIACDNKTILRVYPFDDEYKDGIVWETIFNKRKTLISLSPNIVNDRTIVLPTTGPVYAFDIKTGEKLADKIDGEGLFSTKNSVCVNGNRLYILTEYHKPVKKSRKIYRSSLYAVNVNPNKNDVLTVAWKYDFEGSSGASPLFIGDTIYFDGYIPGTGQSKKRYIYAITDMGKECEEKWPPVQYPRRTMFSFSKDPRCCFWYEDSQGKRLVRFCEENGNIIEKFLFKNLVKEGLEKHKPMSCMTICDEKDPIMIVSAISLLYQQYVIAIKLKKGNNSVLWKVPITSKHGLNYAGGQFTILKKNNDPTKNRILFGTYWDGVMAIGSAD